MSGIARSLSIAPSFRSPVRIDVGELLGAELVLDVNSPNALSFSGAVVSPGGTGLLVPHHTVVTPGIWPRQTLEEHERAFLTRIAA